MVRLISEALTDRTGNTVFRVSLTDHKGRQKVRVISLEDYVSLLQGSRRTEKAYVHLREGFLPENCRNAFVSDDRNYICEYVVPGKKRVFLYSSVFNQAPRRFLIPYPDLLFVLQVTEGVISTKKVFALGMGSVCNYPFGNVSSEGSICMGNIRCEGLGESVDSFTEDFFAGITNNDYYDPESKNVHGWDQLKLLNKLDGMERFPERWLVVSGKSMAEIDSSVEKLAA